jgi:hypothetical protein
MKREKKMNRQKIKMFFLGVLHLIISPVYIPAMILWEERDEIKGFYAQCFRAITFKEI